MLDAAGESYRATLDEARANLPAVSLAGRFQRIGRLVLDVAHNPDGIRTLVESLDAIDPPRPVVAVLGVLRDKDWREMMRILCRSVERTIVTSPPSAPAARAWDPIEAERFGAENGWDVKHVADLGAAVNEASSGGATVVITGSFHTVGDALAGNSLPRC
jgi:dihydrofolate synthase/folylpolyglutamate synthase